MALAPLALRCAEQSAWTRLSWDACCRWVWAQRLLSSGHGSSTGHSAIEIHRDLFEIYDPWSVFMMDIKLGATLLHPSGQFTRRSLFLPKDIAMSEHFHGRHQPTESLKRFWRNRHRQVALIFRHIYLFISCQLCFVWSDLFPLPVSRPSQVTGQVDGKKALLAMIALDEIRGRLAEVPSNSARLGRWVSHGFSVYRMTWLCLKIGYWVLGTTKTYQSPFTIVYHSCYEKLPLGDMVRNFQTPASPHKALVQWR